MGCSKDTPALQSSWKAKQSFPYSLVCDESGELSGALGMLKASGGVKRGNVVIGPDGAFGSAQGVGKRECDFWASLPPNPW